AGQTDTLITILSFHQFEDNISRGIFGVKTIIVLFIILLQQDRSILPDCHILFVYAVDTTDQGLRTSYRWIALYRTIISTFIVFSTYIAISRIAVYRYK